MKILVTGCCGYIGSHTCVELLNNNYEIVGLDNFSNSKRDVLDKIKKLTNQSITFYEGDMLDYKLLTSIFTSHKIDCVIDFAAYKAVGESVSKPIEYYINNVSSVLNLLKVMKKYGCKKIVFSSSATVYGQFNEIPYVETADIGGTTNPYATSKLFVEKILSDVYKSDQEFGVCILRYFNPVGAHPSGLIGEEPNDTPANLMPYICKVASGELECLSVFGNDYDTVDGTGVRDYIHVVDLARGHVLAVEKLAKENSGKYIYNLGAGKGYSVLEIIKAFENVNKIKVNYKIASRRAGDIAEYYSDSTKALKELNFKCEKSLDDMVRDAWNFESKRKK